MILRRNWGGWRDFSVFFFRFERGSVQNRVCSLYSFLVEENQKAITRSEASDRAEKRDDNRKDNKALR